jgi:uncharacterized membrane protein
MGGVVEVRQLDDKRAHWRTNIGGREKEFDTEITEQIPDKRIAWRSVLGVAHAGVVTFHPLSDRQTRIMLQMEYEPDGMVEDAVDALGIVTRRIEKDLERFKEFIESHRIETEAWRGKIQREA